MREGAVMTRGARSSLGRAAAAVAAALVLSLAAPSGAYAQFDSVMKSSGAAEQLRLGVQAYQRGRYAESLLLFEKALAYSPGERLLQYWLGRAYYKTGFDETALRFWDPLLAEASCPPFLRAKAALVRSSRELEPPKGEYRYVEVARIEGKRGKETFFLRPSALIPRPDGTVFVVAHGSNELLTIDSSGVIKQRSRGGLAGYDRPYGAAFLPDGTLFVTEFNGDQVSRIAPDGKFKVFGSKGRGDGGLIGPQYAAADEDGYLYVTDYGNARVCKFDSEGSFILALGAKDAASGFPGLASPSGILALRGEIFVADSTRKALYRFDPSGNYLGALAEGELHFPEGLSSWEGGRAILVADTDRIASVDLDTEAVREAWRSPDKKARLVSAAVDRNGNLLACDFDSSALLVLSGVSDIAAGYDVEIERIYSDQFPKVTLDVRVRDRSGLPLVGLGEGSFYLSETVRRSTQEDENGKAVVRTEETIEPVSALEYLGAGDLAKGAKTVLVLERSAEAAAMAQPMRGAVGEIYARLQDAGASPPAVVAANVSPALLSQGDAAAAARAALAPASGRGRFDLAVRLAATTLLPSGDRDAVVYLGTGYVDEASFSGMTISELAALMRNNGLRFFAVCLSEPSAALRYLAERTGGSVYSASRPRGLGDLASEIVGAASGRYRFSFESKADTSFGRGHLTVGVEAYLFKKSGKDELGYYAPLR
jgi:DNA-binding beta-propeller fold protein YncE